MTPASMPSSMHCALTRARNRKLAVAEVFRPLDQFLRTSTVDDVSLGGGARGQRSRSRAQLSHAASMPPPLDHDFTAEVPRVVAAMRVRAEATELPAIISFVEHRVPTSRVVAAPGSSPRRSPPGGNCSTSKALLPLGSTGTELGRPRRRQARRRGSDPRPHQRGQQGLPARLGGSRRPPSELLAAPTCQTRIRDYSTAQ